MTKYEDKIDQIRDIINGFSYDTLIECCSQLDGDEAVYSMDSFDEIMDYLTPSELARAVCYGEFAPIDDYFRINVYGNLESTNDPLREGWIDIDELAQYAVDCDEDFGDNEIRSLLDQWEEEEENNEETAE